MVGRYGGVIEKFIGDAVMAVWGSPVAREDDAERAVRAALELVDAVAVLGHGIEARAGVLPGEAAVTLGAVNQGMVAGDIVNTASRLQSAASPGTVLVGETTRRAAGGAIAFEQVGDQALKGKASPVPAWRALRVIAERGGRNRSEGLEAPFTGRAEELRLLKDLFHATSREGRLRLVSVTGPAGSASRAWPGSPQVHRRAGGGRLVARRSVPGLRRRPDVLGARRDGPKPLRAGRGRRPGHRASQGQGHPRAARAGRRRTGVDRVRDPGPAGRRRPSGPGIATDELFAAWRTFSGGSPPARRW